MGNLGGIVVMAGLDLHFLRCGQFSYIANVKSQLDSIKM